MAKARLMKTATVAALLVSGAILAACGGGGGGSSVTPATTAVSPPPPVSQSPVFTPGVFAASSTFKDQCASPRTGVDIENNPFPDQAGSLEEELFWLRSWTNETYLWNDEVADRDPAGFTDRVAYFDVLKTEAVEPSGEDRDDFHFSQPTEDFLAARNSVGNPGYGAEYAIIQGAPPRDIRIAFSEPSSPAGTAVGGVVPLPRGSKILELNGQDVVNGFTTDAQVDVLIELLFPSNNNVTTTFTVEDNDGTQRTVSVTSEEIVEKPVIETEIVTSGTETIGYIAFNTFSPFASQEEIILAMRDMQTAAVDDLVLDLRYNGGGLLAVAAQAAYMIAGSAKTTAVNADFERFIYNDDAGNRNPVDGSINEPFGFFDSVLNFGVPLTTNQIAFGDPLPQLNLNRVFILATEDTCSASEAVINGLRGVDVEVILIGDTTCGKPYGFVPQDNCGQTYYTIQFQGANNKGFGDFADGFSPSNSSSNFAVSVPGCFVADDFTKQLGDPDEGLFAAALQYRSNATCPTVTTTATSFVASKTGPLFAGAAVERQDYYLNSVRNMSRPE